MGKGLFYSYYATKWNKIHNQGNLWKGEKKRKLLHLRIFIIIITSEISILQGQKW